MIKGRVVSGLPRYYAVTYKQEFMFDAIGNMTRKTSTSDNPADKLRYRNDYEYEAGTHRAKRMGDWHYRYDGNGNLVTESFGSPVTVTANNAQVHEENGVHSTDYGFALTNRGAEEGGAAAAGERRDYQWNERNLMKRSVNKTYQSEYRYGADGQRTLKYTVSGTDRSEVRYYNRMFQVSVLNGYAAESKHIYVGETRIVTKRKDAGNTGNVSQESKLMYYYHGDHLGSAQLVTDFEGKIYEHLEYTPYGELWVDHAAGEVALSPTEFRFTGKEFDKETGLYYYGARYLDPRTSRWISGDPAMGEYIPQAPINDEA